MNSNAVEFDAAKLLFALESPEDQRKLLEMVSGQHLKEIKRPVMLLICMIDTRQTTTYGCTEGYAAAFDVAMDHLIIRPFRSDKDTHPLTGRWSSHVPDDGISISCASEDFIHGFTLMAANLENEHDNFKLMVHRHVMQYYLEIWKFNFIPCFDIPEDPDKLRTRVEEADRKIWERLSSTKFPVKEKEWLLPPGGLVGFRKLQQLLKDQEPELRKDAVKANSDGDDQVAENAAVVCEKIMELIRDFNADPGRDVVMK